MELTLSIAFLQTLLLSLLFTPFTKQIATKIGAVDIPNKRKVHAQPIPRLGGLGIFVTLAVTLSMYYFLFPQLFSHIISDSPSALMTPNQGLLLSSAFTLVFGMGIWDDIKTLEPAPKFAIQFIAATLIYIAGFKITIFTGIETNNLEFLVSYPLTILWIVGITNAINLIDGLDGLAAGVTVIALSTMALISLINGQTGAGLASLLLAGAILGFLWYNFRPATIFLGDSGSLFLGFSLALLSIVSYTKTSTAFAIFVPVFALGLPIIDTLLSMIRRFFSWFIPANNNNENDFSFGKAFKSLFKPDKSHIHHRLINRGLSHKHAVLVLDLVSILFGLGALIVSTTQEFNTTIWVLVLLAAVIKVGVSQLKYEEIDLFRNGIFFTIYNTLVINKRHFRKFLDSIFILASFAGAYYLLYPQTVRSVLAADQQRAIVLLGSIYILQLGILWLSGLYKETIRRLGIADVLNIVKSVAMGVAVTALVHYYFFYEVLTFRYSAYILDFYFLGTLILGMRVSFHILKHLFYKSRQDTLRVLICGAGEQGLLALQRLLNVESNRFTPIGFIDENPALEGKVVNGFSVFGGHWKLEWLIRTKNIDELHIADPELKPEVRRRIQEIALKYDLQVQQIQTKLRKLNTSTPENKSNTESFTYVS